MTVQDLMAKLADAPPDLEVVVTMVFDDGLEVVTGGVVSVELGNHDGEPALLLGADQNEATTPLDEAEEAENDGRSQP